MGMSRGGRSSCASDHARQSVFFFGRACELQTNSVFQQVIHNAM